jgi:RNA polymerase sigma factor (sigma-70 family)
MRTGKRGAALASKTSAEAEHVGGRPEALGREVIAPDVQREKTGEVARVLAAIGELSSTLRVTLVLATIEELPHKQIAEILEIPEGTVAWRVNEARRLLRLKLAEDGDAPPEQAAEGRR